MWKTLWWKFVHLIDKKNEMVYSWVSIEMGGEEDWWIHARGKCLQLNREWIPSFASNLGSHFSGIFLLCYWLLFHLIRYLSPLLKSVLQDACLIRTSSCGFFFFFLFIPFSNFYSWHKNQILKLQVVSSFIVFVFWSSIGSEASSSSHFNSTLDRQVSITLYFLVFLVWPGIVGWFTGL